MRGLREEVAALAEGRRQAGASAEQRPGAAGEASNQAGLHSEPADAAPDLYRVEVWLQSFGATVVEHNVAPSPSSQHTCRRNRCDNVRRDLAWALGFTDYRGHVI